MERHLMARQMETMRVVKDGEYRERPIVASIAGHLDTPLADCAQRMCGMIDNAMRLGHHFVISNNAGKVNPFHSMLQRVLTSAPERLTVLCLVNEPVYKTPFKTVRTFKNEQERIQALVRMADYDITYYPAIDYATGEGRLAHGRLVATERERYLTLGDRPRYEHMDRRPDLELKNDLFMIQMELARRERNLSMNEAVPTFDTMPSILKTLKDLT